MNRLIYHDGAIGAIYFPPGKPKDGGTCEFASRKCLKECGLRTNSAEIEAFNFFTENSEQDIVEKILGELSTYTKKMLRWFAAGDCPRKMEDKIILIMRCLSGRDIVQNGFTRNINLWRKAKYIRKMRLVLTVENKRLVDKLCAEGLVAIPDYDTARVKIYSKEENEVVMCGGGFIITCGGSFAETETVMETVVSEEDCGICLDKKIGCFVERVFV